MSREKSLREIVELIGSDQLEWVIERLLGQEIELNAVSRAELIDLDLQLAAVTAQEKAGLISDTERDRRRGNIQKSLMALMKKEEGRDVTGDGNGKSEGSGGWLKGRKLRIGLFLVVLVASGIGAWIYVNSLSDACSPEDETLIKIKVARFEKDGSVDFSSSLLTGIQTEFGRGDSVEVTPIDEHWDFDSGGLNKSVEVLDHPCFFKGIVVWGSLKPSGDQSPDSVSFNCHINIKDYVDADTNLYRKFRDSPDDFFLVAAETGSLTKVLIARIYSLKREYGKALGLLNSIKGLPQASTSFRSMVHAQKGENHRGLGNKPEAISEFQEAVRLNPDDDTSQNALDDLLGGDIVDKRMLGGIHTPYTGEVDKPSNRGGSGKDTLADTNEEGTLDTLNPVIAAIARNMETVPAGSFNMGCPEEQEGCRDNEKPVHRVTMKSFQINKYEVTQEEWFAVMGEYPEELEFKGCDKCPVEGVSWNDVQVFLDSLNQKTESDFRLPSEAEWEYAARGGKDGGPQYSGSNDLNQVAWYSENSDEKTHPVNDGKKKANGLGLYHMSGNVREWCQDKWHSDYQGAPSDGSPWSVGFSDDRMMRGGSWFFNPRYCQVACRYGWLPDGRDDGIGFRLAHSL